MADAHTPLHRLPVTITVQLSLNPAAVRVMTSYVLDEGGVTQGTRAVWQYGDDRRDPRQIVCGCERGAGFPVWSWGRLAD